MVLIAMKTDTKGLTRLNVRAIRIPQAKGRTHYAFPLSARTAHDLIESGLLRIDIWSASNEDGYQRSPVQSRIRKFARYVQSADGWSPLSVVLFSRDPNQVHAKAEDDGTSTLSVDLDPTRPLYVPDGQHRLLGLAQALEANPDALADYTLPAVLMIAREHEDPRYEEATQFFVINSTQKRVPTDLAQRYMLKAQERGTGKIGKRDQLPQGATRDQLKPYAVAVVDFLNKSSGPWTDLIDLPNMPVSTRPISQNSFVESLLPLLKFGSEYGWTVGKIVDTLSAFWHALAKVIPEATAHWNGDGCSLEEHDAYVLRTTAGVFSMNETLAWLVGWHKIGEDPTNEAVYVTLFQKDPEHFSDEWWEAGNEDGAAARGTGRASFKEIRLEVQRELQEHLQKL